MSDYRERACTCHPDEAPRPCPQRYAYSECVLAANNERLLALLNSVRIQMKNQDRRESEEPLYRAICQALAGKEGE